RVEDAFDHGQHGLVHRDALVERAVHEQVVDAHGTRALEGVGCRHDLVLVLEPLEDRVAVLGDAVEVRAKRRRVHGALLPQSAPHRVLRLALPGAPAYNPAMAAPDRLGFGIFLAPFHRLGENPTTALHRDLELIAWLDRLGYDEAWIGEHH